MTSGIGNMSIWHCADHGDFESNGATSTCPECGKRLRFEYRQHSGFDLTSDLIVTVPPAREDEAHRSA